MPGPPKGQAPPRYLTPWHRFMKDVRYVPETDCFVWEGFKNKGDVAMFAMGKSTMPPARVVWLYTYGTIGENMYILPTCEQRQCLNVGHLVEVSSSDHQFARNVGRHIVDLLTPEQILERDKARFWPKVIVTEDGCWGWSGGTHEFGYGSFTSHDGHYGAHRFSYYIHKGNIPEGMFVCHKCDNPPCCNPDHLFLGTVEDNNRDRESKGRSRYVIMRGEYSGSAKVDETTVRNMRSDFDSGLATSDIASRYNMSKSQTHRICHRQSWTHVEDES